MTLHALLESLIVFLASFVFGAAFIILGIYLTQGRRLRTHVIGMISSYLLISFGMAYNVIFRHVVMPDLTALTSILGFLVGDIFLAVMLLRLLTDKYHERNLD